MKIKSNRKKKRHVWFDNHPIIANSLWTLIFLIIVIPYVFIEFIINVTIEHCKDLVWDLRNYTKEYSDFYKSAIRPISKHQNKENS